MSCFADLVRCYSAAVFVSLWSQGAIAEAGAIEALVDLAFKWPSGGEGVLVCLLELHEQCVPNFSGNFQGGRCEG